MDSDWDNSDEDYVGSSHELDPNVFHIWDPLWKPVTIQYSTEQLHSARRSLTATTHKTPSNIRKLCAEMIHEGDIDLDPEYQRGRYCTLIQGLHSVRLLIFIARAGDGSPAAVVWSTTKQMAIIDSLFHNYYVPPVVFAISKQDGYETRLCVDGKQRLTSIQKFFDGQVSSLRPPCATQKQTSRPPFPSSVSPIDRLYDSFHFVQTENAY